MRRRESPSRGMRHSIQTVRDVAALQLCTGCGACAYVSPRRYRMADVYDLGRRPVPVEGGAAGADGREEREALAVCPGPSLPDPAGGGVPGIIEDLRGAWGPVRRVWEGYATDPEVRRLASSGGAVTALSLFALERRRAHGVLHTSARPDRPYLNRTVLSRTRADLLSATGSRYSPASPCDGLEEIASAPAPCVFVGKPCDVAAVARARTLRPELDRRIDFTLAFFCAGTPSTRGTVELLRRMGVEDLDAVESVRYRGVGWPGRWSATFRDRDGNRRTETLSYEESWGFLQKYRQWRCYVCPDHTGEFADVAVGDPWYRPIEPDEPGRSLVLARTALGEEIVLAAAAAGYLTLESEDPSLLPRSQPNLLGARGELWGRLLGLRLAGAPVPRYTGFPTFRFWLRSIRLRQRIGSIVGTMRRVGPKRLRERVAVVPWDGKSPAPSDRG